MMILNRASLLLGILSCYVLAGCETTGGSGQPATHANTDAVIWVQSSTEYAAATRGIYAAATAGLTEFANSSPGRERPMAVVLDVDETVLDNSPYQGQLILDDQTYESGTWDAWIELKSATEVPGVVGFIQTAQSLGVHVAFITNRACRPRSNTNEVCPQKNDTLENLRAIGIETGSTTLYLRGDRPTPQCEAYLTGGEQDNGEWSSDKTSRRACVARDYDIVMLFGDQLGDFTAEPDESSNESGRSAAREHGELWGKSWWMLPNPTYGGWRPENAIDKRRLIRGLD